MRKNFTYAVYKLFKKNDEKKYFHQTFRYLWKSLYHYVLFFIEFLLKYLLSVYMNTQDVCILLRNTSTTTSHFRDEILIVSCFSPTIIRHITHTYTYDVHKIDI